MSSQRIESLYHGYKIIAQQWLGEYRAKAYRGTSRAEWHNDDSLAITGDSLENALDKIKARVDKKNQSECITHASLHLKYLKRAGERFRGHSTEGRERPNPHWKCFNCESHFDEFMGLLCSACNTEVCPHCGACHCNYRGEYR